MKEKVSKNSMINLNLEFVDEAVDKQELAKIFNKGEKALEKLIELSREKAAGTGWFDLPINYDKEEFLRILELASQIRDEADVFLLIGIGGSYLGAKAFTDALVPDMGCERVRRHKQIPEIIFVGNNFHPRPLYDLLDHISDKSVYANVISKSGSTLETAIAFRIIRSYLEERYGDEANNRIIATTDLQDGALRDMANRKGYETFSIPGNVGGRFSVLTAVGLLPLAVAGINVDHVLQGALDMKLDFERKALESSIFKYAVVRNYLYQKGYEIEILTGFEPDLESFAEWWKQLFGESEGKEGKGIFPASLSYSRDLHSMGQYVQEGPRKLFETFIHVLEQRVDLVIPEDYEDIDGLNYLSGRSLAEVQDMALRGTSLAHKDGGVPNMRIEVPRLNAYYLGALVFFFETACALSAYINDVSPFTQDGVEAYKQNMFVLLDKPGTEDLKEELESRFHG